MSDGHDDAKGASLRPSYIAYQVREGQDGKAFFNRVGAAFPHKDAQGFDLQLDAVPVNGRVTLRSTQQRLDSHRNGPSKTADRDRDDRGE